MGISYIKMAVLLVGHCFLRPSDFAVTGPAPFHFRRFGWFVPVIPAGFYAWANVRLVKYFVFSQALAEPDRVKAIELIKWHDEHAVYVGILASSLIMLACYLLAAAMYLYHQAVCRVLGREIADAKLASFKFSLVKATIIFAHLTFFAFIITIAFVNWSKVDRFIIPIIDNYGVIIICGTLLISFGGYLCRMNSNIAMKEIYFNELAHHHLRNVNWLLLSTIVAFASFLPRFLGISK